MHILKFKASLTQLPLSWVTDVFTARPQQLRYLLMARHLLPSSRE